MQKHAITDWSGISAFRAPMPWPSYRGAGWLDQQWRDWQDMQREMGIPSGSRKR